MTNTKYIYRVLQNILITINKRPLLLPAVSLFLFVSLTVFLPVVVSLSLIIVLLGVILAASKKIDKKNTIISGLIVIWSFTYISICGISHSASSSFNRTNYVLYVVSAEDKLSGKSNVVLYSQQTGMVLWKIDSNIRPAVGSTISIYGSISNPNEIRNPGDFDYARYLKRQGINGIIKSSGDYSYYRLNLVSKLKYSIDTCLFNLKGFIVGQFGECSDIAAGMFLGDTSLLSNQIKREFNSTNCSHLLAVSGTHFSGFMVSLPLLLTSLKNKRLRGFLYILTCISICMLTGWTESVTRAATLSICLYLSRDPYSGLSLATLLIGIPNPFALLSNGFLMSFSICLSIHLFSRKIADLINKDKRFYKLASTIGVIIAVQIGMIPFWIILSPRIGLGILIIQFITSFLAQLGCVFFLPSVIISVLSNKQIIPCNIILKLIIYIISLGKIQMNLTFSTGYISAFTTISLFLFIVFRLIPRVFYKKLFIKITNLLLIASILIRLISYINMPGTTIVFIDVGQGDSTLIITNGISVLIDGGTYQEGEEVLNVLDYYSILVPDIVFVTHWDEDHCGGIEYLVENNRVNQIYSSSDYDINVPVSVVHCGQEFDLGGNKLRCLNPGESIYSSDNENSLVLEYISNDFNLLFTGDIPINVEDDLIQAGMLRDVDVLKVAHHGSKYSTSIEFLQNIKPEIAVISVGQYNNYGHPSRDTLRRLNQFGCDIYETRSGGAIILEVYDEGYRITPYLSQA